MGLLPEILEYLFEGFLVWIGTPGGFLTALAGVALGLWWLTRWHNKRRREGEPGLEPHHLILYGLIGGSLCLAAAAGGYAWLLFGHPKTIEIPIAALHTEPADNRPPLAKTIDDYLEKSGRKAFYGPAMATPLHDGRVAMGDATDGRGPFITVWDASMGPWPTTNDGFSESQVRLFPGKFPHFSTQQDRDEFRAAFGQVADMMQRSEELVPMALGARNNLPNNIPSWQDLDRLLGQLNTVRANRAQIAAQLGVTGQPLELLLPKYRLFEEELVGILPPRQDTVQVWNAFEGAMNNLTRSVETFRDALKNHPTDANLHNQLFSNLPPYAFELDRCIGALNEWNRLARRRVDMMRRAI